MATSKRVRTTVTTRFDSPVPRRRSKRKKETGGVVIAILIAAVLFWMAANHNKTTGAPRPVAVRTWH